MELSQSLTQTARTETASARRSPALTSDFDTFLKMLTTQMQNQDPLNPMESTDFAVQLATFSGVEQQVLTNDLLKDLNGQFTLMGMSQLSAWVGKEARTSSDVWYDGRAIPIIPQPAVLADNLVLTIRDAEGTLVAREDVPLSRADYLWLGADAAGNPLPEGCYSLSLESRIGPEVIRTDPVESFAPIREARRSGDDIILVLRGGIEVKAAEVTALRG